MSTLTGRPTTDAAQDPVDSRNWRDHRACADTDPDVFADDDKRVQAYAKEICAKCPVTSFCLQLALDTNTRDGVFGGMTPEERRPLRRSSRRAKPERSVTSRRASLSEAQVLEIRLRAQQGESDAKQALRMGMEKSTIRRIVTGDYYAKVGGPLRQKRQGNASRPSPMSCTQFNNGKAGAYRETQELAS